MGGGAPWRLCERFGIVPSLAMRCSAFGGAWLRAMCQSYSLAVVCAICFRMSGFGLWKWWMLCECSVFGVVFSVSRRGFVVWAFAGVGDEVFLLVVLSYAAAWCLVRTRDFVRALFALLCFVLLRGYHAYARSFVFHAAVPIFVVIVSYDCFLLVESDRVV